MRGQRGKKGVTARPRTKREEKTTLLIVTEGKKTEPNYFKGLKSEAGIKKHFSITLKKTGASPDLAVQAAVKLSGQAYDEVWCVLDVEGLDNEKALDRAIKLAEKRKIQICLSNPCFEVWLLSHFEKRARSLDAKGAFEALNEQWMKHVKREYRKSDGAVYASVAERTPKAIKNARWVREKHHRDVQDARNANSSTEVYRLVECLLAPARGSGAQEGEGA